MDRQRFTPLRSGASALVLLLAAGSPAIANPSRGAALKVLEFEIRQCVLHGVVQKDPCADTTRMLAGPLPEAHLARAWPLATADSGRLLRMPPFGRRMFLLENKDLLEKRGAPYLLQLHRYAGLLLGRSRTQPMDYLLAAQLPDQAEEYEALAQVLGKSLGADPALYRKVVPAAMAGLRDLAQDGARKLEAWLDLFLDGHLASGRETRPGIEALLGWQKAAGGKGADRGHLEALLPLLLAAAEDPSLWDDPAGTAAGPLVRTSSDPRGLRREPGGTPARPSPEAGVPGRRPSAPGSQGRRGAQPAAAESKSTAASLVTPRMGPGGSAAAPGTPLPARALTFSPGGGGPRTSSRAAQEPVESKAAGTSSRHGAAPELSPAAKPAQVRKRVLSEACLTIVSGRPDAVLVLEGERAGLTLLETNTDNAAREIQLTGGAGQQVPLTRAHSYLLTCPGAQELQLPFQIREGAGPDAVSIGLAWTFRSGDSDVIPHEGKELPAHFQVYGGSLVILPRASE